MIYSARPDQYPGSVDFPFYPSGLIDAEGNKVMLAGVTVNMETGHIIYQVKNEDGSPVIDHEKGEMVVRECFRPAPLRLYRITEAELRRLYPKRGTK